MTKNTDTNYRDATDAASPRFSPAELLACALLGGIIGAAATIILITL